MTVDVSYVRKQVQVAIEQARERARQRREGAVAAEAAWKLFLDGTAVPLMRMLIEGLKAEGRPFSVSTPGGGVRLAHDRGRDDYIDLALDTTSVPPQVMASIRYTRGSRTVEEERPVRAGAGPADISQDELLAFLLDALTPFLDR